MTTTVERTYVPKAGKRYPIETPSAAVLVVSGGWPGLRLVYDTESPETFVGEHSAELQDSKLLLRNFQRAWVVFPDEPLSDANLVLQLFDCVDVAMLPQLAQTPPSRDRYFTWLDNVTIADDPDTGLTFQTDLVPVTPVALEERSADGSRLFYTPDAYLGGAVRATEQFIVRLYHVLTVAGGNTREIHVGTWTSAANVDGVHAVSLEHGMTRVWTAGVSSGMTPIPRPAWRLTIQRNAANGDLTNVSAVIYSRSLL